MLEAIGVRSLDALLDEALPPSIRRREPLAVDPAETEHAYLTRLRGLAAKNRVARSFIGLGYYDTITPAVILRNVFENPGWYTPYTPYQAEIAQGRLESLLNFQTTVSDLTAMDVANASLLDEATAAAEAMTLLQRVTTKRGAKVFLADRHVLPADAGVAGVARRAARPRAPRRDRRCDAVRRQRLSACCCRRPTSTAWPRDIAAIVAKRARRGCARRRRHRSPRLRAPDPARRSWRRRRRRQRAALRRAARLRRSACGVLCDAREVRASGAGPDHRRLGRRAGQHRLPDGDPDARAAHPAREGDLEHLHRAGAARQHRGVLRGLSRAGGPGGDRPPRPRPGGAPRAESDDARVVAGATRPTSTRCCVDGRNEASWRACGQAAEAAGINLRYAPDSRIGIALDETVTDARSRGASPACSATCGSAPTPCPRRGRRAPGRLPARSSRTTGVPDPSGLQQPSFRDGDDALHPQPRAQGHRPRHLDDPARLVHDEAERGGRDAADHVARVLAAASLRAGGADRRAISRSSASSRATLCADHRACRASRCSRTPARRASWPACSSIRAWHRGARRSARATWP